MITFGRSEDFAAPSGDAGVPSTARMYDYWLGGRDNRAVDRIAARKLMTAMPGVQAAARANRGFLVRALWFLASQGIQQYLDLGAGFPTSPNVHEVTRQVIPDARVAYVDNDPAVTAHNRALCSAIPGVIAVEGDIRQPQQLLADPELALLIDFTQPVAVLFVAVLHFIRPEEDPAAIVAAFLDRMGPGSFLVISHGAADEIDPKAAAWVRRAYGYASTPVVPRATAEVAAWFGGLELAEPGLVDVAHWRPERTTRVRGVRIAAGVGRMPST
jgi:S-adenosyl methyltransferase